MTKKFGAGLALGIIGTILVAVAIWLTVAYAGAYNVAASDQHFDAVRWTLDTTMHRSVANWAGGAELPENFSQDVIAAGAKHYAESCAYCHGTPGGEPAAWSRGMRPEPAAPERSRDPLDAAGYSLDRQQRHQDVGDAGIRPASHA